MSEGTFTRRFDARDWLKLTDFAYAEIKSAIIDFKLHPGDVLREAAISDELGVSKTPIREAFVKLEHDGFVELIPFRGAQVTGYSVDDVRELFELREILQGECVRLAAESADEKMIGHLRANVDASRVAAETDDLGAVIRLFDEFDEILMSRLNNRRVKTLIRNLEDHMMRIGKLAMQMPGRVERSIVQHAEITDSIASGDGKRAREAMSEHIGSVLADEIELIESGVSAGENQARS